MDRARVRASVSELGEDDRERLVDGLLEQLSADRDQLPDELRERLLDGMVDELIAGKRGEAEILGSGGVLGELTRRLVERALSEELSEHLGYPAGHAPVGGAGNTRICCAQHMRCYGAPRTMLPSLECGRRLQGIELGGATYFRRLESSRRARAARLVGATARPRDSVPECDGAPVARVPCWLRRTCPPSRMTRSSSRSLIVAMQEPAEICCAYGQAIGTAALFGGRVQHARGRMPFALQNPSAT